MTKQFEKSVILKGRAPKNGLIRSGFVPKNHAAASSAGLSAKRQNGLRSLQRLGNQSMAKLLMAVSNSELPGVRERSLPDLFLRSGNLDEAIPPSGSGVASNSEPPVFIQRKIRDINNNELSIFRANLLAYGGAAATLQRLDQLLGQYAGVNLANYPQQNDILREIAVIDITYDNLVPPALLINDPFRAWLRAEVADVHAQL